MLGGHSTLNTVLLGGGMSKYQIPPYYGHHSSAAMRIEDFFLRPAVKKAILVTLLLSRAHIKVLKDALAHLGPYPTLMWARNSDPGGQNTVLLPTTIQI